jgi:deoxyadenosine/deoxycytidine kinase
VSRYIVIEGLIGVGKTSLCRLLEREWGARLVLEPAEDNPFLAAFYADRERFAFPAQMFYLATRFAQQTDLHQPGLFDRLIVSDYLYAKDRLFAELTLSGDELALYDRFAGLLSASVTHPDFVLFLDAPTRVILERIKRRAIPSEQVILPDYLDALRSRYYALWDRYDRAPVYVLDTTSIDYVDVAEGRRHILDLIRGWLERRPLPGAPQPYRAGTGAQVSLFGG